MRPSDAFRDAARSFDNSCFTKEELQARYYERVDGGTSDTHFKGYFCNFKRQFYRGVKIEQIENNQYKLVISSTAVSPISSGVTTIPTSSTSPNPGKKVYWELVNYHGLGCLGTISKLAEISVGNSALIERLIPMGLRSTTTHENIMKTLKTFLEGCKELMAEHLILDHIMMFAGLYYKST